MDAEPKDSAGNTDEQPNDVGNGDREWQEVWNIGSYRVEAVFAIINGVEIPWPVRVDILGDDLVVKLGGRNLLPQALLIADVLRRHIIRD